MSTGNEETLRERLFRDALRMIKEHDDILREWFKFLIGIQAAIVGALWAVVSFSSLPEHGFMWLFRGISLFGIGSVAVLTYSVYRVRQWQQWFIKQAQKLQPPLPDKEIALYPLPLETKPFRPWVERVCRLCGSVKWKCSLNRLWRNRDQDSDSKTLHIKLPSGFGPMFNGLLVLNVVFVIGLSLALWQPSRFRAESKTRSRHVATLLFTNSLAELKLFDGTNEQLSVRIPTETLENLGRIMRSPSSIAVLDLSTNAAELVRSFKISSNYVNLDLSATSIQQISNALQHVILTNK
jgi:hypothetical protein